MNVNRQQFFEHPRLDFDLPARVTPRERIDAISRREQQEAAYGSLVVRAPATAVRGILQTGDLRSQHETGTSRGLNHPPLRTATEGAVGFRGNPVYGYLRTGDDFETERIQAGNQYGDFAFEMRDSVRDRTTLTWGDSLIDPEEAREMPRPVPVREAQQGTDIPEPQMYSHYGDPEEPHSTRDGIEYVEAQIHSPSGGGRSRVPLSDARRVEIEYPNTAGEAPEEFEGWEEIGEDFKAPTYRDLGRGLGQQFQGMGVDSVEHVFPEFRYQAPLPYSSDELQDQGFEFRPQVAPERQKYYAGPRHEFWERDKPRSEGWGAENVSKDYRRIRQEDL